MTKSKIGPRLFHFILVFLFAPLLPITTGTAVAQDKSFPVEPLNVEEIAKPDFNSIIANVQNLATKALLFQQAADELDKAWDGSPESANRIVLVKLQIMDQVASAIPLTVFTVEQFKSKGSIFYEKIKQQKKQVSAQRRDLESEIAELAGSLDNQPIDQVEPALVMLMAKKLERFEDLKEDLQRFDHLQTNVQESAKTIRRLELSLQLFREMAIEETKRQQDAVARNRLARQSTLLRDEAEKLVKSVNTIDPAITKFPTQVNPPVMLDQALPAEPIPQVVSPEAKALVERFLDSRKK